MSTLAVARRPCRLIAGLHLAALWSLAVAQPLFDLLSDNAEFFVARENTAGDIVILALGLVLVPPAALLLVEELAHRLSPRLEAALHLLFVALLSAAVVAQALEALTGVSGAPVIALAALAGGLCATGYALTRWVPTLLAFFAVAPVVFVVSFLFFSPVSKLVLPGDDPDAIAVSVGSDAPVVMVVFDELPLISLLGTPRSIDATRYPAFATLARHATWFRNATAPEWSTDHAVPAILTGRRPPPAALPIASDAPRNLFTLLGGSLRLNVDETATHLCPASLCERENEQSAAARLGDLVSDLGVVSAHLLLPDDLRSGLPAIDRTFGDFAAGGEPAPEEDTRVDLRAARKSAKGEDRAASFERFLASLDARGRTLNFHHALLPHQPWEYLPSAQLYAQPSVAPRLTRSEGSPAAAYLVEQSEQRHLLQLGFADRLLGALIDRLRTLGIWRSALVVVTADHGISFDSEEPEREPTRRNLAAVANVPLFVKSPGKLRGGVVERHVCTTEILSLVGRRLGARLASPRDRCREDEVAMRGPGGTVRLSFSRFLSERARTMRSTWRRFEPGRGWRSVYDFGPATRLIGREPTRSRLSQSTDADAAVDDLDLYANVRRRGPFVPSLLEGTIGERVRAGEPLAIAVNGRIVTTTRAYALENTRGFQAMLGPGDLLEGANEIEVLRVNGGSDRRLSPEHGRRAIAGGGSGDSNG